MKKQYHFPYVGGLIRPCGHLFLAFLVLLLSCFILEQTKYRSPKPGFQIMENAAIRAEAAFHAIREERQRRGLPISLEDDPNRTGLIGSPYTPITTTLGNLEAKRSTTNPNIAAMIADMLIQCGVGEGSTVAVNFSSSFPAVNLAVLCALDALDADGIIISSVGASTYGANLPEFTYPDMEHYLYEHGYVKNHSLWFSLGGAGDQGKEMPDEVKKEVTKRLSGFGLVYLNFENLDDNIAYRMSLYDSGSNAPVCFINAGGNLLSFGGGSEMISAKNGIALPGSTAKGASGLVPLFLDRGIPVIHLLNMKRLLPSYGLPIDPIPLPKAGAGMVYEEWRYRPLLAAVLLICNAGYLLFAISKFPHRRIPI